MVSKKCVHREDGDHQHQADLHQDLAAETPLAEDEWKEIALRARAELSNYQKRGEKERAESLRYANGNLLKALLPVLDNLERVVQTGAEAEGNPQTLLDGVKLTLDMLQKVLRDHHVEPIAAEGQPFDPHVHEAVMVRPSDHAEQTVLQEVGKGYKLHERMLRPARVIVSKPASSSSSGAVKVSVGVGEAREKWLEDGGLKKPDD